MTAWEDTLEGRAGKLGQRLAICLVAACSLNFLIFLTADFVQYPDILALILFLPNLLIPCDLSVGTESLKEPIIEAGTAIGKAMNCYFISLILGIPYQTLMFVGGWYLLDKLRRLKLK